MSHCESHAGSGAAPVTLCPGAPGASFPGALRTQGAMETPPCRAAEKMNGAIGCPSGLCVGVNGGLAGDPGPVSRTSPTPRSAACPCSLDSPSRGTSRRTLNQPQGKAEQPRLPLGEVWGARRSPENRFPPSLRQLVQAADQTPELSASSRPFREHSGPAESQAACDQGLGEQHSPLWILPYELA